VRALIVTNMYPSDRHPALGSFVRDQVRALQRQVEGTIELYAFEPGGYLRAAWDLRSRYRGQRFDVVHAHFGLSAWPALAVRARVHAVTLHGTDLAHPRSRVITLASLRLLDLVAAPSEPLAASIPGWALRRQPAILPTGVDMTRFQPIPRASARSELGLDPTARYLLFPADQSRPEKRYDRALELAGNARLLTLGQVDPAQVPLFVNAADAVLVPSEREGFGLAVLEALACDVPVIATDVGAAPALLAGVEGTYCGPFEIERWQSFLAERLAQADPRISGRSHAEPFSTDRMAVRVLSEWRAALDR
jgi:teichuronic acid biosynthesis glycosyltransferase TuaC